MEDFSSDFEDLDNAPPDYPWDHYANQKTAAGHLKIPIQLIKKAKASGCDGFHPNGRIYRKSLTDWLKANGVTFGGKPTPIALDVDEPAPLMEEEEEGGVGRTLKSLQVYERKLKRELDIAESMNDGDILKEERVTRCQDAWLKVTGTLLKYDLSVSEAKRESGELIPVSDATKGVEALLAWHTVAQSEALRNVIPELEGKTKIEIAVLLDQHIRSSIYRNFKSGVKLGKIPGWMTPIVETFK